MRDVACEPTLAGAGALARKLKAIPEPVMRRAALAAFLVETGPDEACAIIRSLIRRARATAAPEVCAVLDTLTVALEDDGLFPYETRAALYIAAKEQGHQEVARLFLNVSPATLSEREEKRALAVERAVVPRGRVLTLGERKSLARSHRREMLLHILRDPHPDVVRIVLHNPHITERDVLVIASRRPSPSESLAAVAAHPRWSVRHPIKRALVLNPHTPVHLSVRIATTLRVADLRQIAGDPNLAAPLRQQAESLLEETDAAAG